MVKAMIKKISIEKVILFLAAGFAAYNFGLAGKFIEHSSFSFGGMIVGIVVSVSLAVAASRYGSLHGKNRTRQATAALIGLLVLSPIVVSPVIYYSLPMNFLNEPLRVVWSVVWVLIADIAIVAAGAASDKGLINLTDAPAEDEGAQTAGAVRGKKKRTADALRNECAALSAQYACAEPQCGWTPSVDALIASAQSSKSAKNSAASAKAGHMKNKHPKPITIDPSLLISKKSGE